MLSTLFRKLAFKTAIYRKLNGGIKHYLEIIHWYARSILVIKSKYNKKIKKIPYAGSITKKYQIMHQGVKVPTHAYCGPKMTELIKKSNGIHEPEEEYYFGELLKSGTKLNSMLELGSYWAYYSVWFKSVFNEAQVVCLDTSQRNLEVGKKTFDLNKLNSEVSFIEGFISNTYNQKNKNFTVDNIIEKYFSGHLDILHSDIQGYELLMLQGAKRHLSNKRINYLFISTHSNEIHNKCKEYLIELEYKLIVDVELKYSSSFDGLLIFSNPNLDNPFENKS